MKVSVIVLNWNGRRWLRECLSSILRQEVGGDFEVLLVDNCSTDDSAKYVRQKFPKVRMVQLDRNYGFAQGNNIGLEHTSGEYLVFVNMDTVPEDGWLSSLVEAADKHPEYQILCSIQLPSQKANRARILNAKGYPMPSPHESKLEITDSLFASGACFLTRKAFVREIGYLFDPFYFSYAEDLELSLRTVLLGGRIGYVRDSRIFHHGGGAGLPSPIAACFSMRNVLLTYYKLFRLESFVRVFFVQIAYTVARLFARRQQMRTTLGMLKGFFGFFSNIHRYTGYRRAFLQKKKRDDKYVFERFLYGTRMAQSVLKRAVYGCRS
jgi:GT2 family glycosyltransferase